MSCCYRENVGGATCDIIDNMDSTIWRRLSADSDQLYRSGQFGKAVEGYSEIISVYQDTLDSPDLALIYNNRGHAKYMMVDFYKAKDDYDRALKLDPCLAVAYYNRGTIHYRMGDFDLALDDFKMSIKLEPSNPEFSEGLRSCQQCLS